MTAACDDEAIHLVDLLPPTQVRRLRLLVVQDEELSSAAARHRSPRKAVPVT